MDLCKLRWTSWGYHTIRYSLHSSSSMWPPIQMPVLWPPSILSGRWLIRASRTKSERPVRCTVPHSLTVQRRETDLPLRRSLPSLSLIPWSLTSSMLIKTTLLINGSRLQSSCIQSKRKKSLGRSFKVCSCYRIKQVSTKVHTSNRTQYVHSSSMSAFSECWAGKITVSVMRTSPKRSRYCSSSWNSSTALTSQTVPSLSAPSTIPSSLTL